ncbi:hypothetical protein LMH87_007039 [Akanthomyces muscarius]|uniref:HECT-type E3 ubiquitin transferase n=1 Tax=Akanthomyces muscarius TaxID=2231603 RepID=A0A9W8QQ20_AKAMU|nr:hypothetical protein LMH87_007039 [Akanthomyces muscarius]KAJ4165405.1 hypothetical protein LMH87_007039 [Akanthomyces muscarius]
MSAQALRLPQRSVSDSNRRPEGLSDDEDRYDLFAGLWQESPFVRLPSDAPPQLSSFVRDIENPRRVYAIHRASRRHDFQLLVQLYIHQLRDGCGNATCITPTCFSCRKRLVGKSPIRRYNPTSARTLAIYLASQDNPERGICPSLRRTRDTTPAVNNLVFSKCSASKPSHQKSTDGNAQNTSSKTANQSQLEDGPRSKSEGAELLETATNDATRETEPLQNSTEICVSERPVTRDYRSFAATAFGTVAFKMIEWLTPNSLDAMSKKISDLDSSAQSPPKAAPTPSSEPQSVPGKDARDHDDNRDSTASPHKPLPNTDVHGVAESRGKKDQSTPKRTSKPAFRPKSTVETTRRKSIEPVCVTTEADNTALHRSTRMNGYHPDKLSRRTKSPTTITFKPAFFENVPIPASVADEVTVTSSDGEESTKEEMSKPARPGSIHEHEHQPKQQSAEEVQNEDLDDAAAIDYPLPQTLSQLNIEIIDFICDVYIDDGTSEDSLHGTLGNCEDYSELQDRHGHWARTPRQRDAVYKNEWRAFHEQTLFSVLSDPAALVTSFSKDGKLFDSHTLWHCMFRLTRASPSLVLHSLWMSAAKERLLHETRVPTLLLDWARAVLLHEWDGKAQFHKDGTFYGALLFMDTLYANRNVLLLGEIQFRVEYFSERLDAMRVPVQWMATKSTDSLGNLLDYPYLFRSEMLVTYFRSINFACMSRTFEEASSLKRRMSAIVDPGSLITNPHHKVVLKDMLRTAASKYLVLDIGRTSVLRDAFDQLWRRQKRELLRPLKIHLGEDAGEEGFDSGGVQQEFFRLAVAECLDPVYGAFTVDDRNYMAWFKPQSAVEDWKFELMGLLLSLAVYNGLTLPVNFPKAFYRKLLGEPVDQLYHIADGWPELTSGLTTLLEWDEKDGLIEDIFARTYEFSVPGVGKDVTIHMLEDKHKEKPGSPISNLSDVPEAPYVTNENRDDYVADYIRYLTDYSSVVEGVQEIDISELRRYTRYVGWDTSHHTVRDFWSIVKRYDDRMKRKLLEFVTASDRVPVSGLKNVQFIIQKNGEETEGGHLPTAYTCYGTLLLPEYRDKEVLRERLGMALENAQGFGFA